MCITLKGLLSGSSRQDLDSDSDSNLRPDLDSGLESLKKRIFDKLNPNLGYYSTLGFPLFPSLGCYPALGLYSAGESRPTPF